MVAASCGGETGRGLICGVRAELYMTGEVVEFASV
jgi:hypothetical protein